MEKFNGVVYLEYDNGDYCKYCVLFARGSPTTPTEALGILVNRPLIDFKRATEKLSDHFAKKFHKTAVETAETFSVFMKNPDIGIDHRLSQQRSRRVADNRLKLASIAGTVLFCGRQGLAFMGHRAVSRKPQEAVFSLIERLQHIDLLIRAHHDQCKLWYAVQH